MSKKWQLRFRRLVVFLPWLAFSLQLGIHRKCPWRWFPFHMCLLWYLGDDCCHRSGKHQGGNSCKRHGLRSHDLSAWWHSSVPWIWHLASALLNSLNLSRPHLGKLCHLRRYLSYYYHALFYLRPHYCSAYEVSDFQWGLLLQISKNSASFFQEGG